MSSIEQEQREFSTKEKISFILFIQDPELRYFLYVDRKFLIYRTAFTALSILSFLSNIIGPNLQQCIYFAKISKLFILLDGLSHFQFLHDKLSMPKFVEKF